MAERKTVEGAYAKIEAHEDLCAERYLNINDKLGDLHDTVRGARRGAWLVGIGVIGWLALQVYDRLDDPPVPAAVSAAVLSQ